MLDLFNASASLTPTTSYSLEVAANTSNTVNVNNTDQMHEDESFQAEVNAIVMEMNRRATIGYGLGYGLGKHVLGTIKDDDLNNETETSTEAQNETLFQRAINWISSFFSQNTSDQIEPDDNETSAQQFDPNDNSTCIEQNDSMLPQGAMIVAADLDVESINPYVPLLELTEEDGRAIIHNSFIKQNERLHNIESHYFFNPVRGVKTPIQICQALARINESGPIKLLILNGHGSPTTIQLGSGTAESIYVENFSTHNPSEKHPLSCLDTYLAPDAIIILESCSTGKRSTSDTLVHNMHTFIASFVPGRTIFAPDYNIWNSSMRMKFGSPVSVDGHGYDEVTNQVFAACKDIGSFEKSICLMVSEFFVTLQTYKEAVPFFIGNGTLPIKPFQVISPEHAPFCKEVLPYFSARKYCDQANIRPSEKKIQKYENDEKSRIAIRNQVG